MTCKNYTYIVVGAGLAGSEAAKAIREHDSQGSILLIGAEKHLPYNRPPLSKGLWSGDKEVDDVFIRTKQKYTELQVDLLLGLRATHIDSAHKTITTDNGESYGFHRLVLATGGAPRVLPIPGGDTPGICYYRYLDDFISIRNQAVRGKRAVIIGGGFIGSEMAAALNTHGLSVEMIYPEDYLCSQVFPPSLGSTISDHYKDKGVRMHTNDSVSAISKNNGTFTISTKEGNSIKADLVIAGIGLAPQTDLADSAGLETDDGFIVNNFLRTSHPDIFAAGDNASFYYSALSQRRRIEHWDCARSQGAIAGANMAGANKAYDYLPYFYADLFEFGYEAIGDTDQSLEHISNWEIENEKGIIYYLRDNKVRGVLMCNVWDKIDQARELILSEQPYTVQDIHQSLSVV